MEPATARDGSGSLFSDVAQTLWLLLIPVALILAGILWLTLVRATARRHSIEAARRKAELEAWYRDLFDNAHDILLTLDVQGRLLSVNRAGREVLGDPADQRGESQSLLDRVSPADRERLRDMVRRLSEGETRTHGEIALTTTSGTTAVWRLNLRRQTLPGRPVEFRGVAWDVTAEREAREAMVASEQRLRRSLEERIRIGRDLHDGIIQSIYAVGLALGECRRLIDESPDLAKERLSETLQALNGIIREVRDFIEGLEPEALKGREFKTALESVAGQLGASERAVMRCEIDPRAVDVLAPKQTAGLLQIAREALSNAIRHSGAAHLRCSLALTAGGGVQFEAADDGCGFDRASLPRTGLGLRNFQARARELGGRCEVVSAPGQGTLVRVTLPEQHEQHETDPTQDAREQA